MLLNHFILVVVFIFVISNVKQGQIDACDIASRMHHMSKSSTMRF